MFVSAASFCNASPHFQNSRAPLSCYRHVVNTFLLIYQIGTCCVYVVFVSDNIQSILHHQFGIQVDVFQVMCCILLPLILINWVRDLKYLAPFSAIANAVTIVSFGIILYYIFRQAPEVSDKVPAGQLAEFPLFFGTVLFALEAIGVVSSFIILYLILGSIRNTEKNVLFVECNIYIFFRSCH